MSYTSSSPASRRGVKRGQELNLSGELCRQWRGPQPASSPSALGGSGRAPTAQGPVSRGSARAQPHGKARALLKRGLCLLPVSLKSSSVSGGPASAVM